MEPIGYPSTLIQEEVGINQPLLGLIIIAGWGLGIECIVYVIRFFDPDTFLFHLPFVFCILLILPMSPVLSSDSSPRNS